MKTWLSPKSKAIRERHRHRTQCGTIAIGRARGLLPAACKESGGSDPTSGLRPHLAEAQTYPPASSSIRFSGVMHLLKGEGPCRQNPAPALQGCGSERTSPNTAMTKESFHAKVADR